MSWMIDWKWLEALNTKYTDKAVYERQKRLPESNNIFVYGTPENHSSSGLQQYDLYTVMKIVPVFDNIDLFSSYV